MNENEELQSGFPDWLTEDYKLMEPVFCRAFLQEHPMRCIRRRFYTVDGLVADELLNALRMAAYSKPIALEYDRIHVTNGTLFVDGRFSPEKAYCNNRLTALMRRRRRSGCAFWRSFCIRRTFLPCRSIWVIACSPLPRDRRC